MQRFVILLIVLIGVTAFGAEGLTPQSPEIRRSVERAVAYLKTNGIKEHRLGGRTLVALALYKASVDPETNPFILGTLTEIKKAVSTDGTVTLSDPIYTAGLIILLLAELDPDHYREELTVLGRFLHTHQRKDGSWTYLTSGTADAHPAGDMSMTQYGALGLWTLHQIGIDISGNAVDRLGRWLTSVQDSEGAYAYHTSVSPDFRQINRNGPSLSMTAAGLSSLYVCRDLYGFDQQNRKLNDIHEAFRERSGQANDVSLRNYRLSVRKEMFTIAQMKGNAWMERNFNPVNPSIDFFYYYLYALERYGAFKELAENKPLESPPWYHRTAAVLLKKQAENGSWTGSRSELTVPVDTAYAVLFLLRSTKLFFDKWKPPNIFDGGNLRGGRGLPRSTDDIRIENGVVVSLSERSGAEQLLEQLDDLQNTDEETLARLADLPAEDVENLLQRNKARIKKMVGHELPAQRFAAVNLLGKSGDVSNTPALIYALTDPNFDVAEAAQKALLRLTRQPRSDPLPKPEEANFDRRMTVLINRWKEWYRTIDPDAVFEDR